MVPAVEEPHGAAGGPRAGAVLRRAAAAGVRPRRRRLPQRAGSRDPRRVLRLHPRIRLRRSCHQELLHGEARSGTGRGRIQRRREPLRRAVRLPVRGGAARRGVERVLPLPLKPESARGAGKQEEREPAGHPRDAQPRRPQRQCLPHPEPPGVAQEVRQALRHGLHRRWGRRVRAAVRWLRLRLVAADRPAVVRQHQQELRDRVLGCAVAQGVRPRAAGDHAGQELLRLRHPGVSQGQWLLRRRGGALRDESAAGDAGFQCAGGADDLHQRHRRADAGEVRVLGRRLRRESGSG